MWPCMPLALERMESIDMRIPASMDLHAAQEGIGRLQISDQCQRLCLLITMIIGANGGEGL